MTSDTIYMTGDRAHELFVKLSPFIGIKHLYNVPGPDDKSRWFESNHGLYQLMWKSTELENSKMPYPGNLTPTDKLTFGQFLDAYNIEITDMDNWGPKNIYDFLPAIYDPETGEWRKVVPQPVEEKEEYGPVIIPTEIPPLPPLPEPPPTQWGYR